MSRIYPSEKDRRQATNGIEARVVAYRLEGIEGAEPLYRLATSILDPDLASAEELAALCHERWEIETAVDDLKTHLRGAGIVLRSKTPEWARQEFHGLLMAHFAVRGLMQEAALRAAAGPDRRLSFMPYVLSAARSPLFRLSPPLDRSRFHEGVLEELLEELAASSRNRANPRGVKRKG